MVRMVCKNGDYAYILSQSTIISADSGKVDVYGISIVGAEEKAEVTDVSNDFNFVLNLFDLIVEGGLYPVHLYDVVEDFLSDSLHILPFKTISQHTA